MVAVTVADIDALRQTEGFTHSGYRNVYRLSGRRDSRQWAAAVKCGGKFRHLGTRGTPREAAVLVAEWYARRYGPLWPFVIRRRKADPWEVRHDPVTGGFIVHVWEWGQCVTLGDHIHPTDPGRDSANRRPWVFRSRDAATAALKVWRAFGPPARWGEKAREAFAR